ncbi:hypothetical protein [Kutzneria chonburiensis]|uniref:PI3K/PI4K catalytic domain-containing protein n=1 Tax=Kutzneria chonburiensis TaxID=1483604 RepID=A0ABV6N229_9PSEU|nr:hypothetical protein [Kutzneria chonburiensis]
MVGGAGQPPVSGMGYFALDGFGATVGGSGGVSSVRLSAYSRQNTKDRPHGVLNDYISSALGLSIGLSVPPGALVELDGGIYGYTCMAFGLKGDRLPPAILGKLVLERPWEAWGIVAFDQWVANTDRHDGNVAYHPKVGVAAFDHDLALLGRCSKDLSSMLRSERDREVRSHEFAPYFQSAEYLDSWCTRIAGVQKEEIRRLVNNCLAVDLVNKEVAEELIRYIDHRKSRVREFISRTSGEYSKVTEWPFELGEVGDVR